jgi:hypothetical protein
MLFKLDTGRIIFILIFAIFVLIVLCLDQCNRKNSKIAELDIKNKGDTLIRSVDNLNRQITKNYAVITSYKDLFDSLQIKIKDINLKQSGSSVTYFSSYTPINFKSKPFIIRDQITNEPTFSDTIRGFDKWITGNMMMNKDTSILYLNIESDYIITLGYDKRKWFSTKPRVPFATVYNLNPYTINRDMKIYRVNMPRIKHFGIGFGVMYGISNDLKTNILVGAGITYNLITF